MQEEVSYKRFFSEEHRRKLSEARKGNKRIIGKKHSEETKRKLSESHKEFYKLHPEKHPLYICSKKGFISSIEKKVKNILDELKIPYEPQFPIEEYFVDFAILDKKIIIECDGDYWHSLSGIPEYDKKRQIDLENLGWGVIRFSETEINNNIKKVENKIKISIGI